MIELVSDFKISFTPMIIFFLLSTLLFHSIKFPIVSSQEDQINESIIVFDQSRHFVEISPDTSTLHKITGYISLNYSWDGDITGIIVDLEVHDDYWEVSDPQNLFFDHGEMKKNFSFEVSVPGDTSHSLNKMVGYVHEIGVSGIWRSIDGNHTGEIIPNYCAIQVSHYFDFELDRDYEEIILKEGESSSFNVTIVNTGNGGDGILINTTDIDGYGCGLDFWISVHARSCGHRPPVLLIINRNETVTIQFSFTNIENVSGTIEINGFINFTSKGEDGELFNSFKHIHLKIIVENQQDQKENGSDEIDIDLIMWIFIALVLLSADILLIVLIWKGAKDGSPDEEKTDSVKR